MTLVARLVPRWVSFLPLLALATAACSSTAEAPIRVGDDEVAEVPQSSVKDQSSDNCWVYATVGWTESLHLAATGKELNLSESYLTYWGWYDQIVAGDIAKGVVEEGGSWGEAADLILKYGMISEGDFIPPEEKEILSKRQAEALIAVNASLKDGGELRTGAARRNRALVRDVLDRAWKLTTTMQGHLNRTFGQDVSRTMADYTDKALVAGAPFFKPTDLKAKLKNPVTGSIDNVTMVEALGTHKSTNNLEHRNGGFAWQEAPYPASKSGRRNFWKRVQRALNDHQAVIVNWTIDFNALTADGKFLGAPEKPGSQGGHVVLGDDYEIDNVPGFGTLKAGVAATPAQLEASLADQAEIKFLRVKNSWSPTYHSLPAPAPGGFHDLYLPYMNGPMPFCEMDAKDEAILSSCKPGVPLESIVLPAGY